MKKFLTCMLALLMVLGCLLPMSLTAAATDTKVTTPLAITEVCFNPTYVEENPYGISKSADMFEYFEVLNISESDVSLATAVAALSKKGYDETAFAQNQLYTLSTNPKVLKPGEIAIVTIYGNETRQTNLRYDSDEALTTYYDTFCDFYDCGDLVSINNFYVAPRYENQSETKIEGSFNLANENEEVVLRLVDGETILAEAYYSSLEYNKNNTAVHMLYATGINPEHPMSSVVFTNGKTTPGMLHQNQLEGGISAPAEDADTLSIKVMHYNVCSTDCTQTNADGSAFSMEQRIEGVFDTIQENNPDVMGWAEVNYVWVPEIKETFTTEEGGYEAFGMSSQGRLFSSKRANAGQTWDFYNLIMWKTEKYELIDSGYFWCSSTPNTSNSFTWTGGITGDFARCINWVILEDKATGGQFFFMCGHIDAKYADVRALSMQLIRKKITELSKDLPTIVVGDWNCADSSAAYAHMVTDGMADARYRITDPNDMTVRGTFNKWGVNTDISSRLPIDLCFVSTDDVYVHSAHMDMGYYKDTTLYSSDHHATIYDIEVLKEALPKEPETEPETQPVPEDTSNDTNETTADTVVVTVTDTEAATQAEPVDSQVVEQSTTVLEDSQAQTNADAAQGGCASTADINVLCLLVLCLIPMVWLYRRKDQA